MAPQTLPLEPLEDLAFHLSGCEARFDGGPSAGTFNTRVFAEMIGVERRTLKRWRARGTITWDAADKAAIRLGEHPLAVWGVEWMALDPDEWGDALIAEAAKTAEAMVG